MLLYNWTQGWGLFEYITLKNWVYRTFWAVTACKNTLYMVLGLNYKESEMFLLLELLKKTLKIYILKIISSPNLLSSRFPHNEMVGGGGVKEFIYYFLQKLIEYIFIFKLLNIFIISLVQVQQCVNAKNV